MFRAVRYLLALGLGGLALTGCRDYPEWDEYRARRDGVTLEAGNAVAHNIAVQTIDPWPNHAGNTEIDIDGERSVRTIDRYKKGKVAEPQGVRTQSVVSDGGGGN